MKVYIQDGVANFFQYQITGTDKFGRNVTLYAKNDTDRTNIIGTLTNSTVTNISPTSQQQQMASQWNNIQSTQGPTSKASYNVDDATSYITNQTYGTISGTVQGAATYTGAQTYQSDVVAQQDVKLTDSTQAHSYKLQYNPNTRSLDIVYSG